MINIIVIVCIGALTAHHHIEVKHCTSSARYNKAFKPNNTHCRQDRR